MSCDWREQVGLYVDGELEPASQQAFSGHVQGCSDCATAVLEQQELKKSVRVAGKRFTAPPELYASVRRQLHPEATAKRGWSWLLASAALVLFIALGVGWYSRSRGESAIVAQLVDQHVTMLASANPVDVVSSDMHAVKPWYQGKLPFAFNFPKPAADSPFTLIGGSWFMCNTLRERNWCTRFGCTRFQYLSFKRAIFPGQVRLDAAHSRSATGSRTACNTMW